MQKLKDLLTAALAEARAQLAAHPDQAALVAIKTRLDVCLEALPEPPAPKPAAPAAKP